jgi:hypothetical protein
LYALGVEVFTHAGPAVFAAEDQQRQGWFAEQAVQRLRAAVAHNFGDVARLETEPDFETLRMRTDFQKLVAGMKQPGRKDY